MQNKLRNSPLPLLVLVQLPQVFFLFYWQRKGIVYGFADDIVYWLQSSTHYLNFLESGLVALKDLYLSTAWYRPSFQQILGLPFLVLAKGDIVLATHVAMEFFYIGMGIVCFLTLHKLTKIKWLPLLATPVFMLHPFVFSSAQKFLTELPFMSFMAAAVYASLVGRRKILIAASALALMTRPFESLLLLAGFAAYELYAKREHTWKTRLKNLKPFTWSLSIAVLWFLPRVPGLIWWLEKGISEDAHSFNALYPVLVAYEYLGPLGLLLFAYTIYLSVRSENKGPKAKTLWIASGFGSALLLLALLCGSTATLADYSRYFLYIFYLFFLAQFVFLQAVELPKRLYAIFAVLLVSELLCFVPLFTESKFAITPWHRDRQEQVRGFNDDKSPVQLVDGLVGALPANAAQILLWAPTKEQELPFAKMQLRAMEYRKHWNFVTWAWPEYNRLFTSVPEEDPSVWALINRDFSYILVGPIEADSQGALMRFLAHNPLEGWKKIWAANHYPNNRPQQFLLLSREAR